MESIITKEAGNYVGLGMTGGYWLLRSDTGGAGASMSGGLLVIRGNAGERVEQRDER